ncbi:MAG: ABC transporter ATP-binding protein [Propionibacteriaceae bacterium]|jgi:teichoic acid transport system ATP-binding protein|nr:ABC transporter ATP-binding protein [Propionibacteriaceae bacterium]
MSSSGQFIKTEATRSLVAVKFKHVTKTYHLYRNDRVRFASTFFPHIKYDEVNANNDLSFTINRGESVAFLGSNGAGKSTALKIITGVTTPTSGTAEVHGRVSALLDLTAGFDAQLTGRENLKLRARLWGLSEPEIADLLPEITDFAAIGKYIDQPMRTYSAGMRARLGFGFASSLKPDILILDEVLAVGDRDFAKKSLARMQDIMSRDGVTLLFVTHSLSSAQKFCKRALVMYRGSLKFDGPIDKGISFYKKIARLPRSS